MTFIERIFTGREHKSANASNLINVCNGHDLYGNALQCQQTSTFIERTFTGREHKSANASNLINVCNDHDLCGNALQCQLTST